MMSRRTDYSDRIGQTFGRNTVINFLDRRMVECRCECGTLKTVDYYDLKRGKTRSCGCIRVESTSSRFTKHGLSGHPLEAVYHNIISRCHNSLNPEYKNYGGRGIFMCDEWRSDNESFYKWAKDHGWRAGLQIDRINNDAGYSPENCRFVTRTKNMRNRRGTRLFEYKGERKTISEWGEILGFMVGTIRARLYAGGMSLEAALTKPVKRRKPWNSR